MVSCDTYWGSHGCDLEKNHEGPCDCGCCNCKDHVTDHDEEGCVGKAPYYGPITNFYGNDIPIQTVEASGVYVVYEKGNHGSTQTPALPAQ